MSVSEGRKKIFVETSEILLFSLCQREVAYVLD